MCEQRPTYRNVVGVDVVGAFLVVGRLELEPRMVVGQNVGEPILGPVARQVGSRARLVPSNVLQFFVLLRKSVTGENASSTDGTLKAQGTSIDYRCDDRRFRLSAHNCRVPTPTSQNLELEQQISDFWSRLSHQLLGRLKSTIPNLQIYQPKKATSEKLGLGIDNPCRMVFFLSLRMNKCLERVNDRHFWNPRVVSYAMIPRCHPNSRVSFSSSYL